MSFARYALSAKAGLAPVFVSILLKKGTNAGIFLRDFDYLVVFFLSRVGLLVFECNGMSCIAYAYQYH
ncbi:hypothetical protein CGSMWGv0288E_02538 [Gardnerella vaginalis 0288E]|nr:hypothetical protein CGSMWGv75712_05865 [Gardnerella vaginalis 75712]EIK77707.1 hypothetical protein CGSMWGv0288E_02538 [Gardnerella vaginalis 0288E]PKZ46822.1 hypothetical protein CYJ67_03105 [Gardnerella vaginalis]CRH66665.1 Uncharacterised protein [Chlamydia trachomatis]RFT37862.1 hypothetical protein CG397_06970 [Gardnerella vaginalis]